MLNGNFTNGEFLEMETLGPLEEVAQGGAVTHTERWSLHRDIHLSQWTDEEIDRVIAPLL